MLFTELVLENFGPYAGKNIINLRTEKDNQTRPIILIGGMNGGGKNNPYGCYTSRIIWTTRTMFNL